MRVYMFEGTAEEFASAAPVMGWQNTLQNGNGLVGSNGVIDESEANEEGLTVVQVKSVLKRRPLGEHVKTMFRMLYKNRGRHVSSDELKEVLKLDSNQFRGMMGAFGRRVAHTRGVPNGVKLFDEIWDHEQHQKTWSLPENVRTALKDLKIV